MPDYANTVMYKICCKNIDITDIYVGHTTNIRNRIKCHKNTCNNPKDKNYHYKVYEFIRNNGGWDNWEIIVIEEYSCNSFSDAIIKEREYYETLKPTLNSIFPQRTNEEYKECKKQYNKEYYNENKQHYNEYNKEYYQNNKEKINEYHNENKQHYNEYHKEYYQNNKEKINEKVICECGSEIRKRNLSEHLKTAKHIHLLSFKDQPCSTASSLTDI
jgi:hypothetical protein